MAYNKMGFGGVVLILLLAAVKIFNVYQRHAENNPSANNPPALTQHERMRQKHEQQMEQWSQGIQHDNGMNNAHRNFALNNLQSTQERAHNSFAAQREASERRYQEQLERDRQRQAEQRARLEEAMRAPTYTPPTTVTRPKQHQQEAQPTRPTPQPQPVVPEVVEIQPFEYSPKPDDALMEKYKTWQADNTYDRFLGETFTFGDWRFRPSKEFELQRSNSRMAKWGAGKAGIGLDADLFKLYPRDRGMTCPVHEDTETKQVFRLGRREIRARGDAEVNHLHRNGLMIWRIHTPAQEGDKYGSCYYMAILGEEDAILFTCRYDAKRPEQIAAFDAVVQTLEYVKAE